MTQGRTPDTLDLFDTSRDFCDRLLAESSIYRLLYEHGDGLFPDEFFADLYSSRGRASVPPRILATVMVLQRLGGLSDREAVDRFTFDLRWKFACGGLEADYPGFVHTVLVNMRARLRRSDSPTRIFEAVLDVAKEAGLVGPRRALDSTPLYDAVATQDTVTLIRSSIRGVLRASDAATGQRVRGVLERDDTYDTPGKPVCDWDDADAREQLVDALARDGYAVLALFDGEELPAKLDEAVRLLATVLGQDLEEDDDGIFRIMRGTARDRVISTVDPETRHGHKTSANKFDGYKGHLALDPDSEIVTKTAVTAGNVADGDVAEELLEDILDDDDDGDVPPSKATSPDESGPSVRTADGGDVAAEESHEDASHAERGALTGIGNRLRKFVAALSALAGFGSDDPVTAVQPAVALQPSDPCSPAVFGDASYGAASVLVVLDKANVDVFTKVPPPTSRGGRFSQAAFGIDREALTVTCPAGHTVALKLREDGSGRAAFGKRCETCPLREQCTSAKSGRTINTHAHFDVLQRHRQRQQDEDWQAEYQATRPKVERKIAHLVRRKHGGRRARVRGRERVANDFSLLAAATNLARLAQLGLQRTVDGWTVPA